ncbi:MAG TPA: nickel-dependent hydrogenase large subunit [Ktedonobacterales bacterium]
MGPYHPALTQPLGLALRLRGEIIASIAPPTTGYGQRGIAELVEGASLDDALAVIERSCALAGTTHRIALCQAVEAATETAISTDARLTRVLFAELERLLARLWLLGIVSRASGQLAPFRDALEQREALFSTLEEITGQRVYWAIAIPGGARADLELAPLANLLDELAPALDVWRAATGPNGPLGRVGQAVGVVSAELASALELAGLAAAGSGLSDDLRRDAPYGGYADLDFEWPEPVEDTGDVAARARRAVEDLAISLEFARAAIAALDTSSGGAPAAKLKPPRVQVEAETRIEGPHGPVALALALSPELTISHLRLTPPGATLLAALPQLLEGRTVAQAPAILASLDLCMDCLDQ